MCVNLKELEKEFQKNFTHRGELGASVSVWKRGEEIISLHNGWSEREEKRPWTAETMVPFYSATKGLSSAVVLYLLGENNLTPADLVSRVWPEFPQPEATFAQLMSHQLGLAALDKKADVYDHASVIDAIENQTSPNWQPNTKHGYHPRTIGYMLDEIARRLSGETLGQVWRDKIAEPLGLDAWIGLPEEQFERVARLYPGKQDKSDLQSGFYGELHREGSLVRQAFFSPRGLHSVREMNEPQAWQAALPAMGGIGTAQALAKFYQAACGAIKFFSDDVRKWMETMIVMGDDQILQTRTAFSCGFQLDPLDQFGRKDRHHYGLSRRGFGHPGAGGSHAFGDPESGISFAYVMNQMELSPLPKEKSLEMIKAVFT
ncbi:MAG: serine hydrolase domain-containing protein [Akkermansiaceae bacterium]